ncbi:MAG: cob(I)yrinic acid a,c-diamide adenosyltransferase [Alphaproteobacteria bacterium]|nr:cob(I)yrinic acid a,c-diamide adenosyltransferase [Alphaproteobacteria bacterium]
MTEPRRKKTDTMSEAELDAHHAKKMKMKKAARNKMISAKPVEHKGLVMINTGHGKGKTTAAMGLAIRAIGNGFPVHIIQFVKGVWPTGERKVLESFPDLCTIRAMGKGFSWETQDRQRDIQAARIAWDNALQAIQNPKNFLVILDEINIPLRYGHLKVEEIITALRNKPENLHVLLTGRNAPDALKDAADMVSEINPIKHHFRDGGVKAQLGIEY